MMFNSTFKNISVILWQSVLLVEETTDLSQVTDKLLSHNVVIVIGDYISIHRSPLSNQIKFVIGSYMSVSSQPGFHFQLYFLEFLGFIT
jgi:hypothetical protein